MEALEHTRGKYISVFDLFFKYSSPIPARHPIYPDFFVTQNEQTEGMKFHTQGRYLGFVRMNTEPLEDRIVGTNEKVVADVKDIGGWNSREYDYIWNGMYYRNSLTKFIDKIFFFEDRNHPIIKNNRKKMFYVTQNTLDGFS